MWVCCIIAVSVLLFVSGTWFQIMSDRMDKQVIKVERKTLELESLVLGSFQLFVVRKGYGMRL